MSFDMAYNHTMRIEGGYVNDKRDRGGETYRGIARRWHPSWAGWVLIDAAKKEEGFPENLKQGKYRRILDEATKRFYKAEFWDKPKIDAISDPRLQMKIFDFGVNAHPKTAVKSLQRALNLMNRNESPKYYRDMAVDGFIGSVTMKAISMVNMEPLLKAIDGEQYIHYRTICEEDPTQEVFFVGWLKRIGEEK